MTGDRHPTALLVELADGHTIALERGVDLEQLEWMLAAGDVLDGAGQHWRIARDQVAAIRVADQGTPDQRL